MEDGNVVDLAIDGAARQARMIVLNRNLLACGDPDLADQIRSLRFEKERRA
jgi:hypothetical protein